MIFLFFFIFKYLILILFLILWLSYLDKEIWFLGTIFYTFLLICILPNKNTNLFATFVT